MTGREPLGLRRLKERVRLELPASRELEKAVFVPSRNFTGAFVTGTALRFTQ
jgi:hypothetical protein